VETIAAICEALTGLGHTPIRIGGLKPLARALVDGQRWDAVFNICEGLRGVAREAQVPALLEGFEIPCFFSDPLTLALSLDKALAKRVVRDAGVPTADFALIETEADIGKIALPFPVFLKPVSEGSGKGVDARSRVADKIELDSVARDLLARFRQPVLVEEFLPGREFTVGITGTGESAKVLGVIEIVPTAKYVGHGYGLENKSDWEGKLDIVPVDDADARAAAAVALAAWRVLRCRDGGRADVRQGADGKPRFIEVNPLAGIRPGYSDLCFIADFQKISYSQLIGKFLDSFLARI
jgi:D-alanine-D-alanine ligase